MKIKLNNRGFTHLEIFLLVFVFLIIGGVGYKVYSSSNNKAKTPVVVVKKSSTPAKVQDPYSGWKSFCSNLGGLCMKYPVNWTYVKEDSTQDISPSVENNVLKNPADNFEIVYSPSYQIGGTGSDVTIKVLNVVPTQAEGLSVYSIVSEDNDKTYSSGKAFHAYYFINRNNLTASNDAQSVYSKDATIVSSYEPVLHKFNNPQKATQYSNQLMQIDESFSTYQAAAEWFSSANVNNAGLIMKSTRFNQ